MPALLPQSSTEAALPSRLRFSLGFDQHSGFAVPQLEQFVVPDSTADYRHLPGPCPQVTFLHGLHLVDTPRALDEAHRLLKPRGKLVAAWNDRRVPAGAMPAMPAERRVPGRLGPQRCIGTQPHHQSLMPQTSTAQRTSRAVLRAVLRCDVACRNLNDPFIRRLEDLFEKYNPNYRCECMACAWFCASACHAQRMRRFVVLQQGVGFLGPGT
jgi:SAM-dependent methyltransferase